MLFYLWSRRGRKENVEKLTFEVQEDRERFSLALAEGLSNLEEMETRLDRMQVEQEAIKRNRKSNA